MAKKTTTIRDLARRAGVSETTVSLAFRPASRISDATRARVLETAQALDYVPNLAARTLRRGQPRLLGALVNDLTNPFYAGMVRVREDVAQAADHQIVVMESQWQPDREVECLTRMIQSRVRGVLFCPCEQSDGGFTMQTASCAVTTAARWGSWTPWTGRAERSDATWRLWASTTCRLPD